MKTEALLDLLAAHADALNRKEAIDTVEWLATYPSEAGQIASLLQLAWAINQVLVPVRPSALFRAELQRQLAQTEPAPEARWLSSRAVWWSAAIIGSILSVAGVLLWLFRRFSSPRNPSQAMPI